MEEVILVNEQDEAIGTMEKIEAHQKGVLHRAFSIVLFNSKGELLLQKRATGKYHSGGLWTNTCCSHPLPGEEMSEAAARKLMQEMGIRTPLTFSHKFLYQTSLDNGLTEHEYDHVFIGHYDNSPSLNAKEAEDWKFSSLKDIQLDIQLHPHSYTYWFRLMLSHPELKNLSIKK